MIILHDQRGRPAAVEGVAGSCTKKKSEPGAVTQRGCVSGCQLRWCQVSTFHQTFFRALWTDTAHKDPLPKLLITSCWPRTSNPPNYRTPVALLALGLTDHQRTWILSWSMANKRACVWAETMVIGSVKCCCSVGFVRTAVFWFVHVVFTVILRGCSGGSRSDHPAAFVCDHSTSSPEIECSGR